MDLIQIKSLHKSFGNLKVLNDININFKKGETVAIIGPSGSGKSTFLRTLNGLVLADEGVIKVLDEEITQSNFNFQHLRTKVGMVFQNFNLFPHMNVLKNITLGPITVLKQTLSQAEQKALELLERVGLKDKALSTPSSLSGGQKQRVAIARALAMEPQIMLFDEPTSALDPEMVKEVLNVIKEVSDSQVTSLIVTHEMNFAKDVAKRILFLDHGSIIEDAAPHSFFSNPQSQRAKEFLSLVL